MQVLQSQADSTDLIALAIGLLFPRDNAEALGELCEQQEAAAAVCLRQRWLGWTQR
jgi:hypothetical protein